MSKLINAFALRTVAVVPNRRRRGATFIEYALLAAVAVILFWIFRDQLVSIVTRLMSRLTSAVNAT